MMSIGGWPSSLQTRHDEIVIPMATHPPIVSGSAAEVDFTFVSRTVARRGMTVES
jgi:hypothetical protein